DAGFKRVQIGSFVNPKLVPQMAGTDEVWRLIRRKEEARFSVLVLNERGLRQALEAGPFHIEMFVSASEAHSMRNSNMGTETAVLKAADMLSRLRNKSISATAGVMCAFGCYEDEEVPADKVVDLVRALDGHGPEEIGLADTAGYGDPNRVRKLLRAVTRMVDPKRLTLHLHDTRGFGMSNLQTGLEMGIRRFDSSLGGLGGCPFLPGARGNISTEMTAERLKLLGYGTGLDLHKLLLTSKRIRECVAD
ncbi:MAG: hydroxymethylglutaryl-CoA lyase, partial [Pseudomonadota bacterium]